MEIILNIVALILSLFCSCGQMALRPVLKSKVDELFRQWICDTETEALLWESLKKITRGEHVGSLPATTPRQPSPRIQLSTAASTPPCSPISTDRLGSPRGRSLFGSGKQSGRHGNQNSNSNDLVSSRYNIFLRFLI